MLYPEQFYDQTCDQKIKELDTVSYVHMLGLVLNAISLDATSKVMFPTDVPLQHFRPADWVFPQPNSALVGEDLGSTTY